MDLQADDVLIDKDQGWLRVQSVIDQHRIATSYNLTVADFHTYYVTQQNVLVHNCGKGVERGNKKVRRKEGSLGQYKGTDALRRENKVARDAATKAKLNKDQQKTLHDEISGRGLSFNEIVDIAQDIKDGKL